MIDNHIITINEGDSIYFDSGHPHGMKALNGRDAKDLVVLA
jgi:mannose-6-phosphate isomerase-like protein (cupin superfamily)